MLLTSWVESMRLAFEKSRKATLNPRRRLQLRSVPSSARQKIQHKVAVEQLEDRTLLTSLIINQVTPGLGVSIDNSVLDPDADGVSNFDSILFEDLTIAATSGAGVSIDLDNLTFNEPFEILFDNVTISSTAGVGVDIELSNLLADTIAVDSSTITGDVGNAFNIDLTNVTLNEFNVIDSTLSGQLGAGITAAVNASIVEETSLRRSTIDGVSFDVLDGSVMRHTTMADNTIAGTSGNDGVNFNVVDSTAEELRITNNNSIQGIAVSVDDTVDGGAALLTDVFIHGNNITGNTAGDGVRFDLNNVDQFVSITDNFVTANSGHGIVFNQTDGDLSGDISGNTIANNTGHGVYFTPTTTNQTPTGGAPGVPAFAGIPGPTDKIDFAAARNEVQLITFEGLPTGGSFTISYTGGDGVTQTTTLPLTHLSTAAQVKAAMVDAFDEIGVGDILVNGNFIDGYEIEFVNAVGGRNINPLTVDPSGLTLDPVVPGPTTAAINISEVQHVELTTGTPIFGYVQISLYGRSVFLDYTTLLLPDADIALAFQGAINQLAFLEGFIDAPVEVTVNPTGGFDITFLPDRSLRGTDVPQIAFDDSGLNYGVAITQTRAGSTTVNELQRIDFQYRNGLPNPLIGGSSPFILDPSGFITNLPPGAFFTLSFLGNTTGPITIVANDPAQTALNIETALNFLDGNTTDDDFNVTGDFASGFTVEFIGAHDRENVALMLSNTPVLVDLEATTVTEGFGQNEIQTIIFPTPPGDGTFTLDFSTSGNGPTVALPYNATAAEVQAALEGLDVFDPGDVLVTGSIDTGGFAVEFTGQYRVFDTLGTLSVDDSALIASVPTVTTISEGTTNNEVQEISVDGTPTGGDFTLSFDGATTTIAFDADAAAIIAALVADIPTINDGDVMVRGDALSGFEIEFVGSLANTNTPQVIVDDTNLTGATLTVKTTTVGGYLRGIRGNTITGNTGAGVQVELDMYTSFFGDLTGNTIGSNNAPGINLEAADPTTLHSVDFSLNVDGNTLDDNNGAGVAVSLQDTATGDVRITNNTITGTDNDNNVATPYSGDAIYIDLFGTDVSFEAFSQLRDLTIDGNYIGTDAANSGGLGNFGSGVAIHIEESTIIDRTQISNNMILNNLGDGVNFHREDDARVGRAIVDPIVGEERAVMIYGNTITGNSDGVDILAQNGSLTTTDFEIKDNIISSNARDGVSLHAEADALIFADIINNEINSNLLNGIESTTRTTSYFGTDRRDVAGTWIQNDISNNSNHGVRISGRIGNHNMLFIGLNGVDPVTGFDRGNLIEGNARDGIQIAALQDRIAGNVKIANNAILSNATGGVELLGESLTSSIDNNLIAFNTGKGVDINSNGQTIFMRDNIITENTSDGLEVLAANNISLTEDNFTLTVTIGGSNLTSLTAIGNFIDNNGGRGVDLQTEEQANSDLIFGDGTFEGSNRIVSNALEGFYVVTTASRGQDQDANSTAALDATGSVESSNADMVLQINRNLIQDNGVNSGFSANGLIMRIGSMAGEHSDFTSQQPGTDASVGAEGSDEFFDFGDGRSNVSVTNNAFEGNFGEDVYIESFTSTVDPNTTADTWVAPTGNPAFRVLSTYEGDPLARLNLVFDGNTGNGLNVTNVGAFYDNAEPDFKSRLNNKVAPNPDGPFTSATRRRNAQRVASRTDLPPTGAPNPSPTAVGDVADAFLSTPGGPIQITTTTAHGLSTGDTVEITGVASDELGFFNTGLSAANGVFVIDVIDGFNFLLRSTEGAELGNVIPNFGRWSSNDNGAFLFPGMGVSTFRIAQGFDGVGNGFQQGDSFLTEIVRPGTIFGELTYNWDIWTPNEDTFLAPVTSTFLTADISVAVPDPNSGSISSPFIISFTEDVIGVDLFDFELLFNNAPVDLVAGGAVLTRIDARTFSLNLDTVTSGDGEYQLRLLNNGSITDSKYIDPRSPINGDTPSNFLLFGDVERFTIDTSAPTASFVEVAPPATTINSAVGNVVLNFSEDVNGVDLADFELEFTPDGGPTTVVNLASTPATLTQVTGSQFVLDLSKVTGLSGSYTLTLVASGSSITDLAGNAIAADADVSWDSDSLAPTLMFTNATTLGVVDFEFPENVSGLAISDFTLLKNGVPVDISSLPALPASGMVYQIDFGALTSGPGQYELIFNSEGSVAVDDAGNKVAGSSSITWENGTDFVAPTAGIQFDETTGIVTVNFSEEVFGLDITDFELFFDDGTGPVPATGFGAVTVVPGSGPALIYTLDLSSVIATDGDGEYTLNLLTDGTITDAAGNSYSAGATEIWRIGTPALTATIEDLPDVLVTNAGIVTVTFSDPVDSADVDINDFRLTLNGQNVSLAGLTVNDISATEYELDLSSVTNIEGSYVLTLVALGSDIQTFGGEPLITNAVEAWENSSTIDLSGLSPVLTDGTDETAGDGIVGAASGDPDSRTLRAAIQEANALVGSNVIILGEGIYQLGDGASLDLIDEDFAASGDLDIRDNLTIRGQGVGVTVIDAGAIDRIFQVFAGVTLNLENLTIQNGALTGSADGAGIRNSGTTTLTNVEVINNNAADSGGGINNTGLMFIIDSTVAGNTAGGSGGGIRNTGTLEIIRSTISGNTTERDGGGLFNAGAGNVTMSNSTFSGNESERSGGAIRNTATVTATNNTVTQNSALTTGGAINNSGVFNAQNNLVIGNVTAVGGELLGAFNSLGGNLTGTLGTATGFGALDITNQVDSTTILESNLADNGGPTLTHALVTGSIAIDAGVNANVDALEQRGSTRILGSNVDIGAVEVGAIFVNSFLDTVDANPGDGVAADENGLVTLRAAIMEANASAGDSVIVLGPGIYYLTITGLADDTAESGDLDITDTTGSLTIIGTGDGQTIINAAADPSNIDAVDLDERVFDVRSGADLTLEGLTVTGGNALDGSGGGIRNIGTLALVNTLVDGNTSAFNAGGILNGELGQQGILTLDNSVVSNNTGVDGGGIFNNDQSQIIIVDSEISGNTASGDGGGLYNDLSATIDITRTTISGNSSALDGGGIYNNDLASLTIADSKVNNNTADQGGGIFNEEAAALNITGTMVSGNTATLNGGGIYNDEGIVSLSAVSILNNTANTDGGGFYNASAGQVTISNAFFDDNTANRDGGAIANFGISMSLSNTIIRDSLAARNGGGLFNDQEEGVVSILTTTFVNNAAASGGGIYNQELGTINLDFSDVLNNTASSNGGGIFNTSDATATIQRTTIDGNTAVSGAGIYNEDLGLLDLFDSTVSNNVATGNGGGIYNNSLVISSIVNATISGNAATNGGGIYNDEDGFITITNATIFNNSASGVGGGVVSVLENSIDVANTIIAGNSAPSDADVSGVFNSLGNNLIGIGDDPASGFSDGVNGDQIGTGTPINPGLGALQDNGGATFTHELLGGSLARDAGNNFFAPTSDQRGFARLFDGDGNGSLVVDIGAFESGYIVTAFGDSVDANPGDGVSVDSEGRSTLRAAIMEANARAGADTILLGIGTYTLSLFGFGEDNAALGDLDITDDLTIIGAGVGKTIIDADFLDRIFHIFAGINVSITGVTLVNGDVSRVEDGGAILNYGNLTLEDVEIKNSLANRGGALFNNSVVTITNGNFHNNTAIADGGAIFNSNGGTITLNLSRITDNNAENGGGIYNTASGTLEVIDTTLDGNSATIAGGAIYNSSEEAVGNGEGGDDSGIPDIPDPTPTSQYTIDVVFTDSSLTASQQAIFQIAADRWSEIILGDVPDVVVAGIGLVDDLSIEATAPAIDGVGGILGQAGPRTVRAGSFIPSSGVMQFDSADLAALEASGQLLDVILHEMGHVIGIGTIWQSLGLLVGAGTTDPRFTGAEAIAQYNALLGRNVADIPVEGSAAGPGTADAHWRESDLDNELMTGFLNSGVPNPISVITIGSLADLGYVVDLTAADPFPLQAPPVQSVSIGEMLDADPFIVLDPSAFVSVEAGAGTVTMSNSTVSNNTAGTRGGGLLNEDPIVISNVTFSGNEAGKEGGAIHNTGELTINNTTIYDNETEGSGGGIYSVSDTGSVEIKNTIVAGNNALVSGADVEGVFTSQGNNLIGTRGTVAGFVDGFNNDIVGSDALRIDPVLSALQDNGGPTLTHALLAGSKAIDNGDNTDGVTTDQRGATRPTDTTSDIGAFELIAPSISIEDVSQIETDSGTTIFEFLVTLSSPSVDTVFVEYETSNNGSAEAGTDYQFTTGTVMFAAGETTQIIQVIVNGDTDSEAHETFLLDLFNAVGAVIGDAQAEGTILNDDVGFILTPVMQNEGPAGVPTDFNFEIALANPVAGVVTVDLNTIDVDTVSSGIEADYQALVDHTITFNPGDPPQLVPVVVNGDSRIEGDEDFLVELSNATVDGSGVAIDGATTVTGTILNDDEATLTISDVTFLEPETGTRDFVFTVTLSNALTTDLDVTISTFDGTAFQVGAGLGDYEALSSVVVTIGAGTLSETFNVTVNSDADDSEVNETFTVKIDSISDPSVDVIDDTGLGTIVDSSRGIVVTTNEDIVDGGDGETSLREAITEANGSGSTIEYIFLPNFTDDYVIDIAGSGENNNATGDFDILKDLEIIGLGPDTPVIDAQGLDRIFDMGDGVNLALSNLKLINGDADDGGAILTDEGTLTLNQVIFEDNEASFLGGAILSTGSLVIADSTFLNNDAGFQGGAIYQLQDTASITTSTFTGNTSGGRGGAIYAAGGVTDFQIQRSLFNSNDAGTRGGAIYNEGDLTSTNTTFSGNHSGSRGGAIFNDGVLELLNNTLTINTADQSGGGISNESSVNPSAIVTLINTIVAGNSAVFADDDLEGDYDTASSFNNLIGSIGSATGLTEGVNGNIVEPVAPINLGQLIDNGGPTLTHTLLAGSPAINAGNNTAAPPIDQRGETRTNDASNPADIGAVETDISPGAPLIGTEGDTTEAEEQTNIQISVVTEKTSVSSTGQTLALPGSKDWVHEWDSFWVEVWVDTADGFSITDVLTDIAYNSAYFTATEVEFGAAFTFSRTYSIDDAAGVVRNLGASSILPNVGETGHVLLARIKFESLEGDQVTVDPTDLSFEPLELGLDILNTEIKIAGVGEVVANVGEIPQTDLYPVIYDVDDNNSIDFKDLTFFASVYNQDVYTSSSPFVTAMDFNKNGSVDFKDLTLLAANYNKAKGGSSDVNFPTNFGQKWIGSSLETVSGTEDIDQVVEAAIDTWETALNLTDPLEVQVIVQDFGDAQLGSGQTTEYNDEGIPVAGRVVIDDDANGLGWHVDSTELPPGGGYDLYTVLLHEIGHVLGFSLYYTGFGANVVSDNNGGWEFVGSDFTVSLDSAGLHIEDPAFPDDLMNATLDPGVRKTPSAITVQMLLESYASAQAGAGSNGGASPLMATNTSPTTEAVPQAVPEVVQSIEAAQEFVKQSTVELATPIIAKKSEEDATLDSVSQTSFNVIQPTLLASSVSIDNDEFDESVFEDLYSSTEFEEGLLESETDDKLLVFAHSADELESEFTSDYHGDQDDLDEAFTDWEGPLL